MAFGSAKTASSFRNLLKELAAIEASLEDLERLYESLEDKEHLWVRRGLWQLGRAV